MMEKEWCRSELHDKPVWELSDEEYVEWVRNASEQMQAWIRENGGVWEDAKWNLPGYRPIDDTYEKGRREIRGLRRLLGMPLHDD